MPSELCYGIDLAYKLPDELWQEIKIALPVLPLKKKSGRPRMNDRQAMTAIYYLLRTGCQWKALPRSLGAASTVHDRFQWWEEQGVFETLWRMGLMEFEVQKGLDWEWQAVDGAMTKAPLGGEKIGRNPTDRGKLGVKRSMLVEGHGLPVGVAIAGANRHDSKLLQATLEDVGARPEPSEVEPQHLSLDKAYDAQVVREMLEECGYTAHIKARGEEIAEKQVVPGYRARRWVVERTHSWLNRFRRILIRWEKKACNYLGFLHFACALLTFRALAFFG